MNSDPKNSKRMHQKIIDRIRTRLAVGSMSQAMIELADWHASPVGRRMLADQALAIEEPLEQMFGYHLLEMSLFNGESLAAQSRISNRWRLSPIHYEHQQDQSSSVKVHGRFDELPFPSETFDVVILHHVLEYSQNPHLLLREASRVLMPKGYLIVFGFNPYSMFGMSRWFCRPFSESPFIRRHSFSRDRLVDWLRLLDCEPVDHRWGFYLPPVQNDKLLDRMSALNRASPSTRIPVGGYHMVAARKDVLSMTQIKKSRFRIAPIGPWAGVQPSTRGMTRSTDLSKSTNK